MRMCASGRVTARPPPLVRLVTPEGDSKRGYGGLPPIIVMFSGVAKREALGVVAKQHVATTSALPSQSKGVTPTLLSLTMDYVTITSTKRRERRKAPQWHQSPGHGVIVIC